MTIKKSEDFLSKHSAKTILFSALLLLTSIGGIVLFVVGLAKQNPFCKQLAVISFAAYFLLTGIYSATKHNKVAILFFILALILFMMAFLF